MKKMICQLLESYHDGELNVGQQAEFKEHLDHCADCQTRLAQLAKIESDLLAIYFLRNEICGTAGAQYAAVFTDKSSSASSRRNEPIRSDGTETGRIVSRKEPGIPARFSRGLWLVLATVASLMMVLISFAWYSSNPFPTSARHPLEFENVEIRKLESLVGKSELNPDHASDIRTLVFEFEGPTFVRHAITTPQFTYIEVYSQFERVEPDAEFPDSLEIDRSTF